MSDIDNHKLMYHPERVSNWQKEGDCFPIYVEMTPTSRCNHRCIFCALDFLNYQGNYIDRDVMLNSLEDMAKNGVRSVMFAGEGEPLAHRDTELFVQKAKEYGMDVSMTTNGVLLNEKRIEQILPHLSWIRFSIDSGSPDNYSLIHGTNGRDFNRLMDNLRECVEYKREKRLDTTIGAQFLVIKQNINEVIKLAGTLKDIGVDNLQIKPYSKHPLSINNLVMNVEDFNKLEDGLIKHNSKEFRIYFRKETARRIDEGINYHECHGLPFFTLVDAKGNVLPCSLFYEQEEFTYGNLYKNSFSEIWKGEKRKEVIGRIREKGIDTCRKGCRLDVINRYLDRLKFPEPHDNFI